MRIAALAIVLAVLVGCVPTFDDPNAVVVPPEQTMALARANLSKLQVGMSRAQVMQIMGTNTHYYRRLHRRETIIPHPYKTATATKDGKNYEILYYLTDHKKGDDALTPVVLEQDHVIGWGWTFLGDNIRRFQIDVR